MKIKYLLPNKTIDSKKNKLLVFFKNLIFCILKEPFRLISKNISYENVNKIQSYSLNSNYFNNFKSTINFKKREMLWEDAFSKYINPSSLIVFLEFGVFQGKSIKNFSELIKNPESKIFGFDTFTGMPEKWNQVQVGSWDAFEKFPEINDKRIKFVKGLFQDTLDSYLEILKDLNKKNYTFVIHLDADLYSSTLYVLTKLSFLDEFYVFFDEFSGDENRALKNFLESYCYFEFKFYSHTLGFAEQPHKVFGKLMKKIK